MLRAASIVFVGLLAALAVFQLALAAGAPLGRFAFGGAVDVLPTPLRIASLISVALYAVFAVLILARAGWTRWPGPRIAGAGAWIVVAVFALSAVANAFSQSPPERLVMTPLAVSLLALSVVVALGPRRD